MEQISPLREKGVLKPDIIQTETTGNQPQKTFRPFGHDGISFFDFLDILNPLQHIPIISTVYRNITGDEIDPASKIAGSALYGGPLGAIASVIDVMVEFQTGKDVVEHTLSTGTQASQGLQQSPKPIETTDPIHITKTIGTIEKFSANQIAPIFSNNHIDGEAAKNIQPYKQENQRLLDRLLIEKLQVNNKINELEYRQAKIHTNAYGKAASLQNNLLS